MVGSQRVAHPGDIIDCTVEIRRPDDPIVAGIGDFAYRSDQRWMHVEPDNEVLATTTFDGADCASVAGVAMPVIWKRRHGGGRVSNSTLGRHAAEFDVVEFREIFRRGMPLAARTPPGARPEALSILSEVLTRFELLFKINDIISWARVPNLARAHMRCRPVRTAQAGRTQTLTS